MAAQSRSIFDPKIIVPAIKDAFQKLNPVTMVRNPVMFVTEIGALVTTIEVFASRESKAFTGQISLWLWFTVLFANFAEAMAEGRGKAQANTLRASRTQTTANRVRDNGQTEQVSADGLRKGDVVLITAGEAIPGDGEIIEGAATVDESAITGESAPVNPRGGRRPLQCHRRHARLERRDQGAHLGQPGREFSGPHDRPRRRRQTSENSQRDRPDDSALGADDHLPAGLHDAAALRQVLGCRFLTHRAHRAAGLPDPDDHRRPALRHRHRGHRPSGAKERVGHERARRGGRR